MGNISDEKKEALDLLQKMNIEYSQGNVAVYSSKGDSDAVKFLLQAGLKANEITETVEDKKTVYYSPLHLALEAGHLDVAKLLIDNGADINLRFKKLINFTPITYAIENDRVDVLKFLIENGVDINKGANDDEYPPIIHAITKDNLEAARVLCENNPELNISCSPGWTKTTPLIYAIEEGNSEIVEILLNTKADTNYTVKKNNETPLIISVRKGNPQIVKFLLINKADVNAARKDGKTSMVIAHQRNNKEVIDILLEGGAKQLTPEEIKKATSFNIKNILDRVIDAYKYIKGIKYSVNGIIILVLFIFLARACDSCSSTTSYNSSRSSSSSGHTCNWCGDSYSHDGYMHIGSSCEKAKNGWEKTDHQCSMKCCNESWNSSH